MKLITTIILFALKSETYLRVVLIVPAEYIVELCDSGLERLGSNRVLGGGPQLVDQMRVDVRQSALRNYHGNGECGYVVENGKGENEEK